MPFESRRPALQAAIVRAAAEGLTQADLIIEAGAKAELYPGHGKITGRLQRGIVGEAGAIVSPMLARGRVAVKGVSYARDIERRYGYLTAGYRKAKDRARAAVLARIREAIRG